MQDHPLNLALRFILETVLLFVFAYWGWHSFGGVTRWPVTVGLPLVAAVAWAVFRVDGDPGKAIVAVPGWLRLLYEALLFTTAAFFLFRLQLRSWSMAFVITSLLHYAFSWQRVLWLLNQ